MSKGRRKTVSGTMGKKLILLQNCIFIDPIKMGSAFSWLDSWAHYGHFIIYSWDKGTKNNFLKMIMINTFGWFG